MSSPSRSKWPSVGVLVILVLAIAVGRRIGSSLETEVPASKYDSEDRKASSTSAARQELDDAAWRDLSASLASAPSDIATATQKPLPTGTFHEIWPELKRRAEGGDAEASQQLATGLRRCIGALPAGDREAIERRAAGDPNRIAASMERLSELEAKGSIRADQLPIGDVADSYETVLNALLAQAAECDGLSAGDVHDWLYWSELAARLGNADARVSYWHAALRSTGPSVAAELVRRKPIVVETLNAARLQGDWRALVAIGEVLRDGYLAEPNLPLAYAYMYAASLAPQASGASLPWVNEEGPWAILTEYRSYLDYSLQQLRNALTVQQREAAERLGESLYRQCCSGG